MWFFTVSPGPPPTPHRPTYTHPTNQPAVGTDRPTDNNPKREFAPNSPNTENPVMDRKINQQDAVKNEHDQRNKQSKKVTRHM